MSRGVDVSALLDGRRFTGFNLSLLAISTLLVVLDGYDITSLSFAAPFLAKAWGLHDPSVFAPVFSASLIGMLIGAPALGRLGDRMGRKAAILIGCALVGLFTLAATAASGLGMLFWLRLGAGIGLGGLLPNLVALNAEYAPRRYRAATVMVMFTGISIGGAIPGLLAATLVPHDGWQVLFVVGGLLPLVGGGALALWAPESLKFLIVQDRRPDKIAALVGRLTPAGFIREPDAVYRLGDEEHMGASLADLFRGRFRMATPLLWVLWICTLTAFFFISSWTPLLLTRGGLPLSKAALATAVFQVGGAMGGVALARPADRLGLSLVLGLLIAGVPAVAAIGVIGSQSLAAALVTLFLAGVCIQSAQAALNGVAAMLYPTGVRAAGAGWALGVGRLGSIMGPVVGGFLIAQHLPLAGLYSCAAAALALGAGACWMLRRTVRRGSEGGTLAAQPV